MKIEGARRVMETTSHETANQYLRFGWDLINQYVVEATSDSPAVVTYVLASVRRLADTRVVLTLTDADTVNDYLSIGWKLIDKYVTGCPAPERRDETIHFVLAWQSDDPPQRPGSAPAVQRELDATPAPSDELF